jgi:cytochrome c biogenesis protein CcmG/thiol:disulfide interchange protein DsbE
MWRFGIPLLIFAALVALLAVGLTRDPSRVPSPLIGKPVPAFDLPRLTEPDRTLGLDDLKGQVSLLNVWGSWCVACRVEHPFLMELAARGTVPIYGLNYKDDRDQAMTWLNRYGNPYTASAFDPKGRVGIDLGVYGAPETYIVDAEGTIAFKQIGPITEEVWKNEMLPLIQTLRGKSP